MKYRQLIRVLHIHCVPQPKDTHLPDIWKKAIFCHTSKSKYALIIDVVYHYSILYTFKNLHPVPIDIGSALKSHGMCIP